MKNFLKKILGKEDSPEARRLKQRSVRVRIPVLDTVTFMASDGRSYPIRNLSESGLALVSKGERFPDEASGRILVGTVEVRAELQVVRRMGDEVGAHFAGDTQEIRGLLRRVFVDELQAQAMTEVESERQKAVDAGKPRWFYAPGNYELFYVESGSEISRFELEWNGNILVYDRDSGVRFGQIDRAGSHEQDKLKHAQSKLVKWRDPVKPEDRKKGARLLENIKGLEASAKQAMQGILR
jgi:hypothetical protein